jgi:hypothetical protein
LRYSAKTMDLAVAGAEPRDYLRDAAGSGHGT